MRRRGTSSATVSSRRPLRPTGSSTSRIGWGCGPSSRPTRRQTWSTLRPLDANVRYPRETAYETLISSSSNAEWHQRLATAPRFIQYIERDVIGNPAAPYPLDEPDGAVLSRREGEGDLGLQANHRQIRREIPPLGHHRLRELGLGLQRADASLARAPWPAVN
jgi:hypothetical protein